jgi:succinoglycan biosynthesis transport protein ExoP
MMPNDSADFGQYIAILKNRKKYFIIPAVAILVIATLFALLWPPTYESSSTILIEEQQIPPEFVRSTVTGFADQRIQSLTQQILSRVKLWEIIQQFGLYREQREKFTREEILENMRKDIKLTTISAEMTAQDRRRSHSNQNQVTIAFTIAYQGSSPGTVQKVAGTLASLYLEQNLKTREAQAQSTTKFLEAELKELNERIQNLGSKIEAFKVKYDGLLPEQQPFNQAQVAQLDTTLKQLESYIRNAEERKVYLQGQLETVNPSSPVIGETGQRIMGPADRLKALEIRLVDLRSKFSDDYPDVVKVRREIASLKKMVGQPVDEGAMRQKTLAQLKSQLAQMQGKYSDQYPEVKKLKTEIAELEKMPPVKSNPTVVVHPDNPLYINLSTQIQAADTDIATYRSQQAALRDKIQMYRQRLENAPKVEQQYLALMRDYQNAQSKHQEVMNKILEARIGEGMEEHQKGEKFTLIDPASYPEKPVSPNRWLIFAAGIFFSFVAGFGTVGLVEHLDHSVHDSDELTRLTGLPVLGSIIRIQTKEDVIRALRKRRLIWVISGASLILCLLLVHLLYMDLWVLAAKLLRLADKYT